MLHLVYFAPENLSDPVVLTQAGAAALVSVLRSLLQNCLLLDFTDYRFDQRIVEEARNLPHDVRKIVKTLLTQLAKANRIIRAIEDDYRGGGDIEALAAQAERLGLELVIIRQEDDWDAAATRVARASVVEYSMSHFETRRSQDMADRHLNDGEMSGQQFIDLFLVPFMRYAERLDVVDGSLGENYRDDYAHTLDRLLAAVRRVCHWRDRVQVTIHCCRGRGKKPDNVSDTVTELARKYGLDGRVSVKFYGEPGRPFRFKHDRCLVSEMGVLNIGRGFDFVQKKGGALRNTVIGFGGPDVDTILAPFARSENPLAGPAST
jgi:hypothetical protein